MKKTFAVYQSLFDLSKYYSAYYLIRLLNRYPFKLFNSEKNLLQGVNRHDYFDKRRNEERFLDERSY